MADLNTIKLPNNSSYEISDNFSKGGGENLLRYTGSMPIDANHIRNYRAAVASLTDTGEGIKYDSSINNGGIEVPLVSLGCIASEEILTCSFYARGTRTNVGNVYICRQTSAGVNTDNVSYGNLLNLTGISTTTGTKYQFTFAANNATLPASNKYAAYFMLAGGSTNTGWLEIKKYSLKLERGHKATDGSPCYKDIFTVSNTQLQVNL